MRVPPPAGSERLAAVFDARAAAGRDAWLAGVPDLRPAAVRDMWPDPVGDVDRPEPPTIPLPVLTAPVRPIAPAGRLGSVLRRLLPGGQAMARVDPGRPGATALALVAAAAAVLAAVGVWVERPRAEPVEALPAIDVTTQDPAVPPVAVRRRRRPVGWW